MLECFHLLGRAARLESAKHSDEDAQNALKVTMRPTLVVDIAAARRICDAHRRKT